MTPAKREAQRVRNPKARVLPVADKAKSHNGKRVAPQGAKSAQLEAAITARAKAALDLKIAGASYSQIADKLGVSVFAAHSAVQRALGELREANLKLAEMHREIELRRCEKRTLALAAAIARGDPRAIDTATRVSEFKARLLGLYPKADVGYSPEQVLGLLRAYTEMVRGALAGIEEGRLTAPAARGLIAQGLREQMGPVGRQVTIDVEAVRVEPGDGDAPVE